MSQWGIAVKELVPILIAAMVWGHEWCEKYVDAQCDNTAVVAVLNSRYSKDKCLMHLLTCLFFAKAYFNFKLRATHFPGIHNELADDP